MFGFIKKVFFTAMSFLSFNPLNVNSLECVSMNNQEYKIRAKIIDINNNQPVFYPFSIKVNKCSGDCNNINDPYAKLCVPSSIKNVNVRVFNLMSRTNQTRHIEWHETWWNEDKCRFECKEEFIDKGEGVIKDLFGIPVIVIESVINHVM